MQVADIPSMYYGYARINYNDTANQTIVAEAWSIVHAVQKQERNDSIMEMEEAVGQGRGDLFIASDDLPDDSTSEIAWQVISKKGRAMFVNRKELKSLGDISLKVRY